LPPIPTPAAAAGGVQIKTGSLLLAGVPAFPVPSTQLADDAGITTAKLADGAVTAAKAATSFFPFSGGMINGTITESHAGNAVTFAVKTLAGATPSSSDKVKFFFRNVTEGTGDYSVVDVSAALSVTISSGSTMGFSNSTPGRIWLMAINNAGSVALGASIASVEPTHFPAEWLGHHFDHSRGRGWRLRIVPTSCTARAALNLEGLYPDRLCDMGHGRHAGDRRNMERIPNPHSDFWTGCAVAWRSHSIAKDGYQHERNRHNYFSRMTTPSLRSPRAISI
jgi:hypothetical protein